MSDEDYWRYLCDLSCEFIGKTHQFVYSKSQNMSKIYHLCGAFMLMWLLHLVFLLIFLDAKCNYQDTVIQKLFEGCHGLADRFRNHKFLCYDLKQSSVEIIINSYKMLHRNCFLLFPGRAPSYLGRSDKVSSDSGIQRKQAKEKPFSKKI